MSHVSVLMTTASSQQEADRIATALVEEKLAACCQALPIQSTYQWKGEICREAEVLLLVKTANAAGAIERIRQLHSYEVPEIVELHVDYGHPPYLRWVEESSGKGG